MLRTIVLCRSGRKTIEKASVGITLLRLRPARSAAWERKVKKASRKSVRRPAANRPKEEASAPSSSLSTSPSGQMLVVGIGASAGGLDALQHFLKALPAAPGMAFVHIQHLDPKRPSMMADLLKSTTSMRVVQATDQMVVEPNCVYINPPDRDVGIFHGKLHLVLPVDPHGFRLPIDFFFRSLAEERGSRAVGIVLSGTGTDGTLGVRALKKQAASSSLRRRAPRSSTACRGARSTPIWSISSSPRGRFRALSSNMRSTLILECKGRARRSGARE